VISVRSVTEIAYLTSKGIKPVGTANVAGPGGGKVVLYDDDEAGRVLAEWRRLRDEATALTGGAR
jgi:hypothetical protein